MNAREFRLLAALSLLYACASFLHFAHNAEYLADYPNLPGWITRGGVCAAWFGIAAIGAAGLACHASGRRHAGFLLLGVYAAFGFDGLLHYTRAPFADHSSAMNATIAFEFATAAALFFFVVNAATRRLLGDLLDR